MLIKYKKFFGIVRILLGILFFVYPLYEYFLRTAGAGDEQKKWLFAIFFFMLYAISAVKNGIKELKGINPSFDLLRFFEVSMNGFLSLYLLIVVIAVSMSVLSLIFLLILTAFLIVSMIRDLRILSLQYYERKKRSMDERKK